MPLNAGCLPWLPLCLWLHTHCTKSHSGPFCHLLVGTQSCLTVLFHRVSCFVSFLVISRSDYFFSSSMFLPSLCHLSALPLLISTPNQSFTSKNKVSKISWDQFSCFSSYEDQIHVAWRVVGWRLGESSDLGQCHCSFPSEARGPPQAGKGAFFCRVFPEHDLWHEPFPCWILLAFCSFFAVLGFAVVVPSHFDNCFMPQTQSGYPDSSSVSVLPRHNVSSATTCCLHVLTHSRHL